jgi:hypothetical protein
MSINIPITTPVNMTDEDGHCPFCVVAAAAAVVAYIVLRPQTVDAPTPNDTYRERSPSSAAQIVSLGAAEALGGPIISKVASKVTAPVVRRGDGEVVERKCCARRSKSGGRSKSWRKEEPNMAEFAEKVKAKPGWKSEPTLKDPQTGKKGRVLYYEPKNN